MNYFLELIKLYKHHNCCITRIDEQEVPVAQDPRLPLMAQLLTNPPPTATVFPSKKYEGSFTVNDTRLSRNFTVDANGMFVGGSDKFNRGVLTSLFGALEGESQQGQSAEQGAGGVEGQTSPGEQTLGDQIPMVTPEQLIQQEKQRLADLVRKAATGLFETFTGGKRCQMRLEYLVSITQKNKKTYNDMQRDLADEIADLAANKDTACEGLRLAKKSTFLKYIINSEEDLIRKATGNYEKVATKQLSKLLTIGVDQLQKLLKKKCPPGDDRKECFEISKVAFNGSDEDLESAKQNINKFLSFLAGDIEINDPTELEKLKQSFKFTKQGQILIKGTSLQSWVMIDDSDRSLYNVISNKFQALTRKRVVSFDLDSIMDPGKLGSIRGKVNEHIPVIANFIRQYNKAMSEGLEDLAKNISNKIDNYVGRIENLCLYVQAMRKHIAGFEKKLYALTAESLEAFAFMRNETRSTRDCENVAETLTVVLSYSTERLQSINPDLVMQVGDDIGDGVREDLVYTFNSQEEAVKAAIAMGLDPEKYIHKAPLKDFLDKSSGYVNKLPKELLGNTNRSVYAIIEGVKVESGAQTTYGSLSLDRFSRDITNLNETQIRLRDRSREALGINPVDYDINTIENHQLNFANNYNKLETSIAKIQKTYNIEIDGKIQSESGSVIVTNMVDELVKTLDYDDVVKNPAVDAGRALAKALEARSPKPSLVEKLKTDFLRAMQKQQLESYLEDSFRTGEDGALLDRSKAAAAADILSRSGQTHLAMSTNVVKLSEKKGKVRSYSMDHGEASTGCLAAILRGEAEVSIKKNKINSVMTVTYQDRITGLNRILTFGFRNGILGMSGNKANSESSIIGSQQMVSSSITRNHPIILETLRFLSSHIRNLSKLPA